MDSQVCNLILTSKCDDFKWQKLRPVWIPTDRCFLDNKETQMIKTRNGAKIQGTFHPVTACVFYDLKQNRIVFKFCAEGKREVWVNLIIFPVFLVLVA